MRTIPLALTSYGLALGFWVPDAIRIEAAMYRLRRIDRLILKGNAREARRTLAAVERDMAPRAGASISSKSPAVEA